MTLARRRGELDILASIYAFTDSLRTTNYMQIFTLKNRKYERTDIRSDY